LIAYADGSAVGQALATSPLRFIGRISYSLYLWHWPVIAFYRLQTGIHLDTAETIVLIAASFAMAIASYYFIEQPALRAFRSAPQAPVLYVGGVALVVTVAAALLLSVNASQLGFQPDKVKQIAAYGDYRSTPMSAYQFRTHSCFITGASSNAQLAPECLRRSEDKPNMVILGDSHAAQFWRAFSLRYPNWNVIQATASGCSPLLESEGAERCIKVVDQVLGRILATGEVQQVVLIGRWTAVDVPLIRPTVEHIRKAGAQVVLVGPNPEYQGNFPAILARAEWQKRPLSDVSLLQEPGLSELNEELKSAAVASGARYMDVEAIVCPTGQCMLYEPSGAPMLFDDNHLTFPATRFVVEQMPAM